MRLCNKTCICCLSVHISYDRHVLRMTLLPELTALRVASAGATVLNIDTLTDNLMNSQASSIGEQPQQQQ